jgi:hypothetical protein
MMKIKNDDLFYLHKEAVRLASHYTGEEAQALFHLTTLLLSLVIHNCYPHEKIPDLLEKIHNLLLIPPKGILSTTPENNDTIN